MWYKILIFLNSIIIHKDYHISSFLPLIESPIGCAVRAWVSSSPESTRRQNFFVRLGTIWCVCFSSHSISQKKGCLWAQERKLMSFSNGGEKIWNVPLWTQLISHSVRYVCLSSSDRTRRKKNLSLWGALVLNETMLHFVLMYESIICFKWSQSSKIISMAIMVLKGDNSGQIEIVDNTNRMDTRFWRSQ